MQRVELGSGSPSGSSVVTWLPGNRGDSAVLGSWHMGPCSAVRDVL